MNKQNKAVIAADVKRDGKYKKVAPMTRKIYRSSLKMKIFNKHFNDITTRTGEKYTLNTKRFDFYLLNKAETLERNIKQMAFKYDPYDFYWAAAERAGEIEDMLTNLNKPNKLKPNTLNHMLHERNKVFYKVILKVLNECAEWLKERLPNEGN